jgi:hypothetical protein
MIKLWILFLRIYLLNVAVFRCLLKTIAPNNIPTIKGRTNNNENSGIEGEGVGDEVGPKLGGEGVGDKVGVASEIDNMTGLLSWLYASMMYGVSPIPSLLASVPL